MEIWTKDRAAKSEGGLCMSKFLQGRGKKRITRLKNTKSFISSFHMKHDAWIEKNVEKRRRDIIENKKREKEVGKRSTWKCDSMKFQRKVIDLEATKTGFKVRVKNDSDSKANKSLHRLIGSSCGSMIMLNKGKHNLPKEDQPRSNTYSTKSTALNNNEKVRTEEGKENR